LIGFIIELAQENDPYRTYSMSHPERLKQLFAKWRVQGEAPCRGAGCPRKTFFTSFVRRLRRRARKKELLRGHPAPQQRAAALCNPTSQGDRETLNFCSKKRDGS